jgi:hypothetical protein
MQLLTLEFLKGLLPALPAMALAAERASMKEAQSVGSCRRASPNRPPLPSLFTQFRY